MWLSKTNDGFPDKYKKNIETFINPIKIWDNDMVDNLIKNHLPEFYDTYLLMTPWISKCDFARFCIIYVEGGIYSDCDFYCTKSLNDLLKYKDFYVFENEKCLFNGFFGSIAQSKFIYGWLLEMENNMNYKNVMKKSGPLGFATYYYKSVKCNIIDTHYILPWLWGESKTTDKDYYVYTLWHEGSGWQYDEFTDWWITLAIVIIIYIFYFIYYMMRNYKNEK